MERYTNPENMFNSLTGDRDLAFLSEISGAPVWNQLQLINQSKEVTNYLMMLNHRS